MTTPDTQGTPASGGDFMSEAERSEALRLERQQEAEEDEQDALALGLTGSQYEEYEAKIRSSRFNPAQAWTMVTGRTLTEYYDRVEHPAHYAGPQEVAKPEGVTPEFLASIRPAFMEGYQQPRTDNHRYPSVPEHTDRDDLLERLKEEFGDKNPDAE
jgi:hypothetical protein